MTETTSAKANIEEQLRKAGRDLTVGRGGTLSQGEIFWRDHQPWLKGRGFVLRRRYHPDWIPSWEAHPDKPKIFFEDAVHAQKSDVLDAIRTDGTRVVLKKIHNTEQQKEVTFGTMISSEPFASHQDNHCVPVLEVLKVPDDPEAVIIVLPYLHPFDSPRFESVGEAVELLRQLFRGLKLLHECRITHRDIKRDNIMADTLHLYHAPPHPSSPAKSIDFRGEPKVASTRTSKPVKYYLIDFGLSKAYETEDTPFLEVSGWGGDRTIPEFQNDERMLCDPFPVDVYCMGNFVREYFFVGDESEPAKKGLEFMQDLIQDMVKDDPTQRPTMSEVVSRFEEIVKNLRSWKLRSRLADVTEGRVRGWILCVRHWIKHASYIIRQIPAIPKPSTA